MSLTRHYIYSTQKKLSLQKKAIFRRLFKAGLGFFSAAASVFCLLDGLVFAGVTITLTSFFFIGFAVAGLAAGVFCVVQLLLDDNEQMAEESNLRKEYNAAFDERAAHIRKIQIEINNLKTALTQWKRFLPDQVECQQAIDQLDEQLIVLQCTSTQSVEVANLKIRQLHNYFKSLQQIIKKQLGENHKDGHNDSQNLLEEIEEKESFHLWVVTKPFNRFITFFGGAGIAVGIAGTLIGVMSTPVGWMVLAAICVLSVIAGVMTLYLDYKFSRSQEKALTEMSEINKQMNDANIEMHGMAEQVVLLKELVKSDTQAKQAEIELKQAREENTSLKKENTDLRLQVSNVSMFTQPPASSSMPPNPASNPSFPPPPY